MLISNRRLSTHTLSADLIVSSICAPHIRFDAYTLRVSRLRPHVKIGLLVATFNILRGSHLIRAENIVV